MDRIEIPEIKISEGENPELVKEEIQRLVDTSGWKLLGKDEIEKTFHRDTVIWLS